MVFLQQENPAPGEAAEGARYGSPNGSPPPPLFATISEAFVFCFLLRFADPAPTTSVWTGSAKLLFKSRRLQPFNKLQVGAAGPE